MLDDGDTPEAEQSRRVWELRSIYYAACGHVDHATKASKAAVEQGKLAVSLGKSTLLDRVAACEQALKEATRSGSKIRAAAARRRR
jgi:hypothetical protein